jgi:hypothetical protein
VTAAGTEGVEMKKECKQKVQTVVTAAGTEGVEMKK